MEETKTSPSPEEDVPQSQEALDRQQNDTSAKEDVPQSQEALDRQQNDTLRSRREEQCTVVGLSNMSSQAQHLMAIKVAWKDLKSEKEHSRLHAAIKKYLYEQQQMRRKKRQQNNDSTSITNNN